MKKQHGSGAAQLAAAQLTHADLLTLVDILVVGDRVHCEATWGSDDTAESFMRSELDKIDDFERLTALRFELSYGEEFSGEYVVFEHGVHGSAIRWKGAEPSQRARRLMDKWVRLPHCGRIATRGIDAISQFGIVGIAFLFVGLAALLYNVDPRPIGFIGGLERVWPPTVAFPIVLAFFLWLIQRKNSVFVTNRAAHFPYIPDDGLRIWDFKTVLAAVSTTCTVIGLAITFVKLVVG